MSSARFDDRLPLDCGETRIRRLHERDLEVFHGYRGNADLARFQGWSAMARFQARAFLAREAGHPRFRPGGWVQLGICTRTDDTLIGDIGILLDRDLGAAELGFTLSPAAQGKGHATRAVRCACRLVFLLLPVREMRALVDVRNDASRRVLERAGFRCSHERRVRFKGEDCLEQVYLRERDSDTPPP